MIGQRVRRREDPELVTGKGKYTADFQPENLLHLAFVRSPYAHARILSIDTADAVALPGVLAVMVGDEVNQMLASTMPIVPFSDQFEGEVFVPERYILATDRVRHIGEPVALILAEDRYIAADAAELIFIDYEPLEVVVDIEAALGPDAPLVHPETGTNIAFRVSSGNRMEDADIEPIFAGAAHVVDLKTPMQRLVGHPMEPRATMADVDGNGNITIWISTQSPHLDKNDLVHATGIPAEKIRVIAPEVGGGFGVKVNSYGERVAVLLMAQKFGRPVRWAATRSEDFQSTVQGRGQIDHLRLAFDAEGHILAADFHYLFDCGAYFSRVASLISPQSGLMASCNYAIPAIRAVCTGLFSNKLMNEPYRGAGRPEPIYLMERALHIAATEMGIDPVEIRRRNFIQPEAFPYTTATGVTYDSGNYEAAFDKLVAESDLSALFATQRAHNQSDNQTLMGIGMASYIEVSTSGTFESGGVSIDSEGKVRIVTGTSPHGQGHETAWAQIASEVLQIPFDDIAVIHSDTDLVPRGIGTFSSRSAALGGSAILNNAGTVKEKAIELAAFLLEASRADVTLEDGRFHVVGSPQPSLNWEAVAKGAARADLPDNLTGGLTADEDFRPKTKIYGFGAHLCVVEIDKQTGVVALKRYVAVDDCGNLINPLLVDGQVHGGIAQGIGEALYEAAVYDEIGNLVSGTLLDYALPRADVLPRYETHHTVTPSPLNPLGVKGIGEGGTLGAIPAVTNAVHDALSRYGVKHIDTPLTAEKIWRAMQAHADG